MQTTLMKMLTVNSYLSKRLYVVIILITMNAFINVT